MTAGTMIRVATTTVTLVMLLTGCADDSGAIDDLGHNGYDRMACDDAKVLAMDLQYGAVTPTDRANRSRHVRDEAAKTGDPIVRQSVTAYLDALNVGDQNRIAGTIGTVTKVCRF